MYEMGVMIPIAISGDVNKINLVEAHTAISGTQWVLCKYVDVHESLPIESIKELKYAYYL